jgi:hypothetical protein
MFGDTEIYAFGQDGKAKLYGTTGQEMLGKTRIWEVLELRHLPPYRYSHIPADVPDSKVEEYAGHKPRRILASHGQRSKALMEIFDLASSEKMSRDEKVVLVSTFSDVVVKKEFLPRLINALRTFTDEHNENLLKQADLLEQAFNDPDVWSVAWNQSSMVSDQWDTYNPYKDGEHSNWNEYDADENGVCFIREPYDLTKGSRHWEMADYLNDLPITVNEMKFEVEYGIRPLRAIYRHEIIVHNSESVDMAFAKEKSHNGMNIRSIRTL